MKQRLQNRELMVTLLKLLTRETGVLGSNKTVNSREDVFTGNGGSTLPG